MFSTAETELCELLRLVAEMERYDATLAAKPEIVLTRETREHRMRKGLIKAD
ncbi:hypothetical protein LBW56_10950 [Ralstonia solanacearum]|uniref:hypothetical protein n=1 Tax=Ralstonia solanacearum TaxID=305 RepID=UPI001FF9C5E4|nr:hypothetical protein [Ralstonia solanacearum]MDB0527208.1 hypothetical protein [Ralstonia solanacearum]